MSSPPLIIRPFASSHVPHSRTIFADHQISTHFTLPCPSSHNKRFIVGLGLYSLEIHDEIMVCGAT